MTRRKLTGFVSYAVRGVGLTNYSNPVLSSLDRSKPPNCYPIVT
nr:MAG TPA: hypothetical protein [Caudoviricetes sp.]